MNEKVEKILNEMREEFRDKSYDEIRSLNWINRPAMKIGWRKYYPSVCSQPYGDSDIVLIVQLTKWYIRGFLGATYCIGILLDENGNTTDVDAYWLMHEIGHP